MRLRNLQRWRRPQPSIDVTQPYYAEGRPEAPAKVRVTFDVVGNGNWTQDDLRKYVTEAYRDLQGRMLADGVFPGGSEIVG